MIRASRQGDSSRGRPGFDAGWALAVATAAVVGCGAPAGDRDGPRVPPSFADVAEPLGLTRVHTGGGPDKRYIVEAKGGGSAVLDFDGDGDLDLYWVNGSTLEQLPAGFGNALYRNDLGEGFRDVTVELGVEGRGWGMGAVSADYDGDGDPDILVTCLEEDLLYRNDGTRGFRDVGATAGLNRRRWTTGAAFGDYDLDGDLDLYIAGYAAFDPGVVPPLGGQWRGQRVFIGPKGLKPEPDALYRNEGQDRFTDVTAVVGVGAAEPGYGLGVLFVDCDQDGDVDLFVANDSSPNYLFRNEAARFTEVALVAGVAYSGTGYTQASMGVAWGDYDGDGYGDLFVTNFEDDYNTLYRNRGDGTFVDVTLSAGLGRASFEYVGFGTAFLDWDNDADLDLFVANGHVHPQMERAGTGSPYRQPDQLFDNVGLGRFELALPAAGDSLGSAGVSRGSPVGDYDNDGDLDVFVHQLNARPHLLRNELAPGRHWLGLRLIGVDSNADGVGARVRVVAAGHAQVRDVVRGSGFLSSDDPRPHFGLGAAIRVDTLQVRWPSGKLQQFTDVDPDRYLWLSERAGLSVQ